jgi:hypothetical protein
LARMAIFFGTIATFLGAISRLNFVDLDMFHEMALFREILNTYSFPKGDVFSYIPTLNPVVHHEWGFGALLYLTTVATGLGSTGLLLFKYLLSAGVCYAVYTYGERYRTSLYVVDLSPRICTTREWTLGIIQQPSGRLHEGETIFRRTDHCSS